jgi:hypothetical protein
MSDIEFVNGLLVKAPHTKAPDFVKCNISIKRQDMIEWLQGKNDEWINVDVKVSKQGKWFASVNNWKPEGGSDKKPAPATAPSQQNVGFDDIPFIDPYKFTALIV